MGEPTNAEIAQGAMAAFSRGELEGGIATLDPAIEWHLAFQLPDLPPGKTVFHGHDEVRELWRAFRSAWAELVIDWEEVEDEKDDILIVRVRFRGRGGASGAEVDRTIFYLLELEDSLLQRIRPFDKLSEARSAAGIGDG